VSPIERADVLLIGGGVASARCARTLRRRGFSGSILLVGEEPIPPYNRPPLSKELIRDDLPDDLVLAEPEAWYARHDVRLRLGQAVTELDPDDRSARLADGSRLAFERCLVATGAEPRRLPVPGGEHVGLLRTLPDARRLRALAVEAGAGARVTVVGGGFIGVEVASGLAALGLRPLIVEMAAGLWGGTLGPELDGWARDRLPESGASVRLDAAVTRVDPDAAWIGEERLEHAFCVAGIGVVPRTALAASAGLAVDDGIVVDTSQRTASSSIWAAGDVARAGGQRIEHWHAAREAGERAALDMIGEPLSPAPAPWVFSEVAGRILDVVGFAPTWDATAVLGEIGSDRFAVAYLADDRVAQVAIVNGAIDVSVVRELVGGGLAVDELSTLDRLMAPAAG
jgi:NADPH-dependent 2,4-dienoyl-CoA reductase/sulfur reductase-like enzyme